jgi:hypothetical protein
MLDFAFLTGGFFDILEKPGAGKIDFFRLPEIKKMYDDRNREGKQTE